MFKRFLSLALAAAVLSGSPAAVAQQPLQWRYSFDANDIATATYPGNVVSNGSQEINGSSVTTLPVVAGQRVEIRKDSAPLNYGDTRAAFVVQQRDPLDLATNTLVPGSVQQFTSTGNGVVDAASQVSTSIWLGELASMTKTGDGSAHSFTSICQVGAYGPGLYNECGGFQGTVTNIGSNNATLSLFEGIVSDSPDAGANNYPSKMAGLTVRMQKFNPSDFQSAAIWVTSEGTVAPDSILFAYPNTAFNQWKRGIDLSGVTFTTGNALALPNNSTISWKNSAGSVQPVMLSSDTDVTIIRPTTADGSIELQNSAGQTIANGYRGAAGSYLRANGGLGTGATTVAGLAAAIGTPQTGDRHFVTDANACTFAAVIAAGGTVRCPVVYDGTNWIAG